MIDYTPVFTIKVQVEKESFFGKYLCYILSTYQEQIWYIRPRKIAASRIKLGVCVHKMSLFWTCVISSPPTFSPHYFFRWFQAALKSFHNHLKWCPINSLDLHCRRTVYRHIGGPCGVSSDHKTQCFKITCNLTRLMMWEG